MNTKTGVARGGKKDITNDFIDIMLQKFEINTRQTIMNRGKIKAVVIVLDEVKSKKYMLTDDMHSLLESLAQRTQNDDDHMAIVELLKKVRGE